MKIIFIVTLLFISCHTTLVKAQSLPRLLNITSPLNNIYLPAGVGTGQKESGQKESEPSDAAHSLTDAQKEAIKSIQVEGEKRALPFVLTLAQTVKQIYDNMLADKPDEALRQKLSQQLKDVTGELLTIKGQSIREAVGVLTPAQKQLVKAEIGKPGAPGDLMEIIVNTFKLSNK